ncbi:MAG: hypothetical protein IH600_01335 [Bacteroidetes bacterium]|nr:hypothetical protein [Bacteroidota bacterium]
MAEPREDHLSLRRVLFVFALVLMLSLNPIVTPQSTRIERAQVEYVLQRRRRRGSALRGRRRWRETPPRQPSLLSFESFYSLQGS